MRCVCHNVIISCLLCCVGSGNLPAFHSLTNRLFISPVAGYSIWATTVKIEKPKEPTANGDDCSSNVQ